MEIYKIDHLTEEDRQFLAAIQDKEKRELVISILMQCESNLELLRQQP